MYGRQDWQARQCIQEICASAVQPIPLHDPRFVHTEKCQWQNVMSLAKCNVMPQQFATKCLDT